MLRLLVDQNFDHDILRGLLLRVPLLDAVTTSDVGMGEASDPELLTWAAREARILVTHDLSTMPAHAADIMIAGDNIAGVIVAHPRIPLRRVIEDLELIISCSENYEWMNTIRYLPF